MRSSSSILSIRVWSSSVSFGVVHAVKAIECDVESLENDGEAAGNDLGLAMFGNWSKTLEMTTGLLSAVGSAVGLYNRVKGLEITSDRIVDRVGTV